MKIWKVVLVSTLLTLAIGGIYLLVVFKHRQNPGVVESNQPAQTLSRDDLAVVREFFPVHFEDTQRLEDTSVWMRNGYTIPFYPYVGAQVVFAKRIGLIPAAQRLDVKKIVKASVPAKEDDGIEHGSRQAFAVFALPGKPDLYATPIGYMQGSEEAYYDDILFYYDDPHTIYDNWPKDVWAAIDAHQVKTGMSELETRMAIGQKMQASSEEQGNRTVNFDQAGKHWSVTYVNDHATEIKQE